MRRQYFLFVLFVLGIFNSLEAETSAQEKISPTPEYHLSIVTMFKNEAFYVTEWIEYHRMIGVDHFYLYNNGSTDNWQEVLNPYIEEGLVEVIDWEKPLDANWVISQVDAVRAGLMRANGHSTWVAVIDMDEFILPMIDKTIPECLANHFPAAAAVFMSWLNFGTNGVKVTLGEPLLFHLNACSDPLHSDNAIGKSIVRPECVLFKDLWYVHHFPLNPWCQYFNADGEPMIFEDTILQMDGKHRSKYIRVNHYRLRDENYFENYRMARIRRGLDNIHLLLEQYTSFSEKRDNAILDFIRTHYPDMYKKIWEKYSY